MAEEGSVDAGNPEADAAPEADATPTPEINDWVSNVEDEGLRVWAESKGFHNGTVEQMLKAHQNLEKVFGYDKAGNTVVLPGPDADEAAMGEFYTKLGRPEKAESYDLPVPDGDDGQMAEWAKGVFHEVGLTDKQAVALSEKWNARIAEMTGTAHTANEQQASEAEAELRKEWGMAYDQKVTAVNHAAEKLGMNEEQLAGLRSSMGPADAMRFVANLAEQMGEATFDNDDVEHVNGGMMTPAAAIAAQGRLMADPNFIAAWTDKQHPSHQWALDEKSRLSQMIAGHLNG